MQKVISHLSNVCVPSLCSDRLCATHCTEMWMKGYEADRGALTLKRITQKRPTAFALYLITTEPAGVRLPSHSRQLPDRRAMTDLCNYIEIHVSTHARTRTHASLLGCFLLCHSPQILQSLQGHRLHPLYKL